MFLAAIFSSALQAFLTYCQKLGKLASYCSDLVYITNARSTIINHLSFYDVLAVCFDLYV